VTSLVSFFDTATEPTEAMRDAMRAAVVGDDVYGRDPTVKELEARAAALCGMEAALLVPTGTMANLAAILTHIDRGDAVVVESESHIARAETGGIASVAGCMPLEVGSHDGVLRAADVRERLAPADDHRPSATLLCVENTHNRAGGTVTPPGTMAELRGLCDELGLRLHVDGARLFNAAIALQLPPRELVAHADSVCFALSKGLGAPVGSLLLGSERFVARARRMRKMLGGGMRQAGVLAAAGLVALDGWQARLAAGHRRAVALALRLASLAGVAVEPEAVRTNIVLCDVEGTGIGSAELVDALLVRGISCSATGRSVVRFVVHGQIGEREIEQLAAAMAAVLGGGAAT